MSIELLSSTTMKSSSVPFPRTRDPSAVSISGAGAGAPRVEVKVKSLTGIAVCREFHENKRLVATVAFSGSANNMRVGSSRLCVETGLLVVESEPIVLSEESNHDQVKFLWLSIDDQPHLTVTDVVPSAVKTPLREANRDSTLVTSNDFLEASISTQLNERSNLSLFSTALQSPQSNNSAAFWSDAIPEIIELTVRVGDENGVAFLVFFGHSEDQGTCTMDLPIRKTADSKTNSVFTDDSRLRVQVAVVVPDHSDALPRIASCSTGSSATMDGEQRQPLAYARNSSIAPLLQKIRKHEQDAREQCRAQTPAMGVEFPQSHDTGRPSATSALCSLWNWEKIRETVAACHRSTYGTRHDNEYDDSSTIGTRDSWEL